MDIDIQQWLFATLGADTDLVDLQERFDRLQSARAVAIEVLRTRRAVLIAQPTVIGVSAVVNINTTANLAAIERLLAELESGSPPAPGEPGWGCPPGSETTLRFVRLVERPRR